MEISHTAAYERAVSKCPWCDEPAVVVAHRISCNQWDPCILMFSMSASTCALPNVKQQMPLEWIKWKAWGNLIPFTKRCRFRDSPSRLRGAHASQNLDGEGIGRRREGAGAVCEATICVSGCNTTSGSPPLRKSLIRAISVIQFLGLWNHFSAFS